MVDIKKTEDGMYEYVEFTDGINIAVRKTDGEYPSDEELKQAFPGKIIKTKVTGGESLFDAAQVMEDRLNKS